MTTVAAARPAQPALMAERGGQYPPDKASEAASVTAVRENAHEEPTELMSAVLDRPNMLRAYARVLRNKGAPGVDGVPHWEAAQAAAPRSMSLGDTDRFNPTDVVLQLYTSGTTPFPRACS